MSQQFGGFGDMFGGFGDIFEGFFGSNHGSRRKPNIQTDDEIVFDLKISLSQIKQGLSQDIVFNRNSKCTSCDGVGGTNKKTCQACNGVGTQLHRMGPTIIKTTCRDCYGAGTSFEKKCIFCNGDGMVQTRDSIKFTVSGE